MESKGYGFHHALPQGDDDMGIFGEGQANLEFAIVRGQKLNVSTIFNLYRSKSWKGGL